ncbi:MAG TPA: diaminopimelate dehydrogenase [Tissierellaceae bacterium]|nr:diaminopimelate dehydrogenase [Tissierellaceae bacterium]
MRVGIFGYGNLGKGVESAIKDNPDMELVGIFTRRNPSDVRIVSEGVKVYSSDKALLMKDEIDVMIICGGSATDLPNLTPELAKTFNVIDSFDTHSKIPEHFEKVNKSAEESKKLAIISVGWDPGLFSINRLYALSILPNGKDYTFWGRGVSQGHTQALRGILGVEDAIQYTIPIESALDKVRSASNPDFTTREKHIRECFIVMEDGADKDRIEEEIINMPNYFLDYQTIVNFISKEEMDRDHSKMPHGGFVIRSGNTGWNNEHKQIIEYSLKLDSNPEFTASVLVAYGRAAFRMNNRGITGCKTVVDVAPADLSLLSPEEIRRQLI